MSRPTRIEYEGALYHVMSRGVARMPVFVDDADRRDFLDKLGEVVDAGQLVVHAFCMMPTHYLCAAAHNKQDCLQSRDSDSANDLLNYAAGAGLCGLFFVLGRAGRLLRSWG